MCYGASNKSICSFQMYKEVVPQIEDIVFSVARAIELLEHFVIYGAGLADWRNWQ